MIVDDELLVISLITTCKAFVDPDAGVALFDLVKHF